MGFLSAKRSFAVERSRSERTLRPASRTVSAPPGVSRRKAARSAALSVGWATVALTDVSLPGLPRRLRRAEGVEQQGLVQVEPVLGLVEDD